jgi:glutathione S-transferase
MLERKRIDHRLVDLPPGLQPILLRLGGFPGPTVPALRVDGRRIQGSRLISRALDQLEPAPPLFPPEPERRRAVEGAEEWGDRAFQPLPRRMFRWAISHDRELRRWMAAVAGVPAPALTAAVSGPVARVFARRSHADDDGVRSDLAKLPRMLDHVDALIETGTIGSDEPNAADYQIATTVRALLMFSELEPLIDGRPAAGLALRLLPRFAGPMPPLFPPRWVPA